MRLFETVRAKPGRIDKEKGIIHGVKLLGRVSKNGREYTPEAMQQAAKLYHRMDATLDHDRENPNRERKIEESVGRPFNIEVQSEGVYGDFMYWKEHPLSGLIVERAERDPDNFGFSHNADGKQTRKGGKNIVESITKVVSLDLVLRPATSDSLFESIEDRRTIREILESHAPSCRLLEMDGMPDLEVPPMAGEAMGEESGEPSSDQQIEAAFKAALSAVIEDSSLDLSAKRKKLDEVLDAWEQIMSTGKKNEGEGLDKTKPESEGKEDVKATESRFAKLETGMEKLIETVGKLAEKIDLDSKSAEVRSLIASHGLTATDALVESLLKEKTKADQVRILESESKNGYGGPLRMRGHEKPSVRFQESQGDGDTVPTDPEQLAKRLKRGA